jgi:hypothetical protein
VLPAVVKLLAHREGVVRARSVACLHAFFLRAPDLLHPTLPRLLGMMGDKDPAVLSAVAGLIGQLSSHDVTEFTSLGPALINVLQQVWEVESYMVSSLTKSIALTNTY